MGRYSQTEQDFADHFDSLKGGHPTYEGLKTMSKKNETMMQDQARAYGRPLCAPSVHTTPVQDEDGNMVNFGIAVDHREAETHNELTTLRNDLKLLRADNVFLASEASRMRSCAQANIKALKELRAAPEGLSVSQGRRLRTDLELRTAQRDMLDRDLKDKVFDNQKLRGQGAGYRIRIEHITGLLARLREEVTQARDEKDYWKQECSIRSQRRIW